jgi:hypothetical protein
VFLAAACTTIAYRLVVGHERRRRAARRDGLDRRDGSDGRESGVRR